MPNSCALPQHQRGRDLGGTYDQGRYVRPGRMTTIARQLPQRGRDQEIRVLPQHRAYGDAVRVLGTLAVVLGHCADMPMNQQPPDSLEWWVCNIVNSLCRWAVPVYVMLSGALLLDPARTEPARVFYRKRLARLGAPLLFWSAFFTLFEIYYLGEAWHASWGKSLKNLLLGQPYAHLHFIFRIAVLYAFTPMLRIFTRHASRSMVSATVILLFVIWSADSLINGYTGTSLSAFARFAPFSAYYLAGYLLRESYATRSQIRWHIVAFFACAAALAGVTGWLCQSLGFAWYPSVSLILYDFLSPIRIPMALCAWIILITLFHDRKPEHSRLARIFAALAPTTLGLYLIHPAFREMLLYPYPWRDLIAKLPHMSWLWNFNGLSPVRPDIFVGLPLLAGMTYLLALAAVLVLMRVPYLRRIVE